MDRSKFLKRSLLVCSLVVLSLAIAAGLYTQASRSQKKQLDRRHTYEPANVSTAPQVRSKIKGLEIVGVTLINQGTPAAAVSIDVTNNRDEAVMALDFVSGKQNYSALGIDGLL